MASSSSSDNNPAEDHRRLREAAFAGLHNTSSSQQRVGESQFDIFEWYPKYQSCQRYFLNHAQHSMPVQAMAAFINILLPFQRQPPTHNSAGSPPGSSAGRRGGHSPIPGATLPPAISLIPFLRRLVATGMDYPGVLHGFFGDDWQAGVGSLHEQERRNYLFAAKSSGWASVKRDYDMPPMETVPFLCPLRNAANTEIDAAERTWSEWLAMEDWMVRPRAPDKMPANERSRMS